MSLETELLKTKKHFSLADKKFVLLMLTIEGVGRKTAKKIIYTLIKHELDFEDFWVNKLSIWQKCCLLNKSIQSIKIIKKEHNNCSLYKDIINKDIRVVAFWENEYPLLLKECDDFPLFLFVKGNINCLQNKAIGVVGTRHITSYGQLATKKIVKDLVLEGFTIVSGFMYGVDLCAHLETINNNGTTIAVLGFGFDHMYPKSHKKYFDQVIKSGGCFITEYLPNVKPIPGNFPTRNRIVAGISKGVVIIEAAKKSGSHITAECAINEGREVFAVPGPINSPFSEGTKWLINQGAILITSGSDVALEFKDNLDSPLVGLQKLIIKELESKVHTLSSLVEITKVDASEISKQVTLLEINGFIKIKDGYLSIKCA